MRSQRLVHAARAIAAQVQGDIGEAETLEGGVDACAQRLVQEKPGEVFGEDFQPGQCAVDSDPHLAEAGLQEQSLRLFHHLHLFGGDGLAIDESAGQAGIRGLVPGAQSEFTGEQPNVRLGQSSLPQRREDAQFPDGDQTRTVIPQVIHVGALGDVFNALLSAEFQDFREWQE